MSADGAGLDAQALFAPLCRYASVGLAVSGGPDSLALLLLYAAYCRAAPDRPRAIVYTLDHNLRSESAAEAAAVERIAIAQGLEVRVLRWEGEKPISGKQAAARAARYRLIGSAMKADGVPVLVTAHHREDQAETVLMRLAHGSGVSGLAGMRSESEVEGVHVVRPLLGIARAELAAVVNEAGLDPAIDPSNTDPAYERARWRAAMPQLSQLGLSAERLSQLATRCARIEALASREAEAFLAAHARRDGFGTVTLDAQALAAAPVEVGIRALASAIALASGRHSAELAQLEALWERIAGPEWTGQTLAGARVARGRGHILVHREAGRIDPQPVALHAGVPVLWDRRFSITLTSGAARIVPALDVTRAALEARVRRNAPPAMAAVRAAPAVLDADGALLALGTSVFAPHIGVDHADRIVLGPR